MKVSPSAVCIMAATMCALGIPAAAIFGPPGLAFLFLFGVSVFGLALFVLDIKA
jgi:hypothetical protein